MARVPSYPALLARPFADTGNKRAIPENTSESGRASLAAGFPPATQLPLSAGGMAPNRLDFNGTFNMITSMLFWAQSGGQWTYSQALCYAVPSIVFHKGGLWWCLKENGPSSSGGVKEPGAGDASEYWQELLSALAGMAGKSSAGLLGNPVGTVIMYASAIAPQGYLVCDGSSFSAKLLPQLHRLLGKNTTPDMRGLFVRGYDPAAVHDPDGRIRALGSEQGDAIRNITGKFTADEFTAYHNKKIEYEGALYATGEYRFSGNKSREDHSAVLAFDASRVVPTANENRPKNINLLYCIRHD